MNKYQNPLSILAMFITLIYSISSIVFGTSSSNLTEFNQYIMVGFVTLFPLILLGSFVYLIVYHHEKLYSPKDFQNEIHFFNLKMGLKPSDDLEDMISDTIPDKIEHNSPETKLIDVATKEKEEPHKQLESVSRKIIFSEMSLFENLIFTELQSAENVFVLRNMKNRDNFRFDGIIPSNNGNTYIEVVQFKGPNALRRLRETIWKINSAIRQEGDSGIIYTIVDDSNLSSNDKSDVKETILKLRTDEIDIRVKMKREFLEEHKLLDEKVN